METPFTDHLAAEDFEHVYEPAEDSFLLLDALEDDLNYMEQLKPCIFLEIGSGSGLIISALAKKFTNSMCLSTDINEYACRVTNRTAKRNCAQVDALRCNLVDGLRPNIVDVLVFNPPYVVTSDDELLQHKDTFANSKDLVTQRDLVYTWAGGLSGRRVIDAILERLDKVLSAKGVFYLLLLRENKPEEIIQQLHKNGFLAIKFKERRIPGEYLYILKITRATICSN